VLVALAVNEHVHHDVVATWLARQSEPFASTPITQGTLLRFLLRTGVDATTALQLLAAITGDQRHEFWPDTIPFTDRTLRGVVGHRQVTDAYLADQARVNNGRLATLDRGIAAVHQDAAVLIELDSVPGKRAGDARKGRPTPDELAARIRKRGQVRLSEPSEKTVRRLREKGE
jgi:uncharacterized protein